MRSLNVFIATPLGKEGRGGIDRLTDVVLAELENQPEMQIRATRLVTRGPLLVSSPFFLLHALCRLWAAQRRGDVDLLHINLSSRGSTLRKAVLARIARGLNIPYVVHPHADGRLFGRFWSMVGRGPRYASSLLASEARADVTGLRHVLRTIAWSSLALGFGKEINALFAHSAGIVVLGRDWQQLIASRLDGTEAKIAVLPNATRSRRDVQVSASSDRIQITFLGELGERKGVRELVQALARLSPQSRWTATLAGNGRVAETAALCSELGITERTVIPGWLDERRCMQLLARTDIFVLPSLAENLPMAILEAFAFGKAVITTPVGAIPEVIDDERNGLLVPPGDVDALAAALDRLIGDDELRKRLGTTAQMDHALRYDIAPYVARLAGIWRQVMESGYLCESRDCPSGRTI